MRRFASKRRRPAALALASALAITVPAAASQAATTDQPARISASKGKVRYGGTVKLRGAVPSPADAAAPDATGDAARAAGRSARIEFRRAGRSRWGSTRRVRLSRSGKYATRVRVSKSGRFRVVGADGSVSRNVRVRVRSTTRVDVKGRDARVGNRVRIVGRVKPGGERRGVTVRIGGRTVKTRTNGSGRFSIRWRAPKAGRYRVSARASSNKTAAGSGDRGGRVTVYRPAHASYYGPGLYGGALACGGTLTPSTIGVAHKTFPCGTKLTLRHGNRKVRVRVIDRGPFVAGREFDLTAATKQRLGFGSTGTVLSSK